MRSNMLFANVIRSVFCGMAIILNILLIMEENIRDILELY